MSRIKNILLSLFLFSISVSGLSNVYKQYRTVVEAQNKTKTYENEIQELKNSNSLLTKKIEYASTSAFLEQQARDRFGLGTAQDVWIITTPENKIDLAPKINIDENKPIFQQWIELFTL